MNRPEVSSTLEEPVSDRYAATKPPKRELPIYITVQHRGDAADRVPENREFAIEEGCAPDAATPASCKTAADIKL